MCVGGGGGGGGVNAERKPAKKSNKHGTNNVYIPSRVLGAWSTQKAIKPAELRLGLLAES